MNKKHEKCDVFVHQDNLSSFDSTAAVTAAGKQFHECNEPFQGVLAELRPPRKRVQFSSANSPIVSCIWWQNSVSLNQNSVSRSKVIPTCLSNCDQKKKTNSIEENSGGNTEAETLPSYLLEQSSPGNLSAILPDEFLKNWKTAANEAAVSKFTKPVTTHSTSCSRQSKAKVLETSDQNKQLTTYRCCSAKMFVESAFPKTKLRPPSISSIDPDNGALETCTINTKNNFEYNEPNRELILSDLNKKEVQLPEKYLDRDSLRVENAKLKYADLSTLQTQSSLLVLYECICQICKNRSNKNTCHHISTTKPKKSLNSARTKRGSREKNFLILRTNTPASGHSRESKKSKFFCFQCGDDGSDSSSPGGSDSENDDGEVSREREQFVEHGAGGSGDEDSGGGSDSGSEESFDSAELFDNFNLVPESKPDLDDDEESDGPGLQSNDSDSLTELQAMRSKKSKKTDTEDDDDTDDNFDELSDFWEILTMYDE